MSETIIISKLNDKSSSLLEKQFKKEGVKYKKMRFNDINFTQRKELLEYLMKKHCLNIDTFISKNSKKYKEIEKNFDDMPYREVLDLMVSNLAMVRTPIVLNNNRITIGKRAAYSALDY